MSARPQRPPYTPSPPPKTKPKPKQPTISKSENPTQNLSLHTINMEVPTQEHPFPRRRSLRSRSSRSSLSSTQQQPLSRNSHGKLIAKINERTKEEVVGMGFAGHDHPIKLSLKGLYSEKSAGHEGYSEANSQTLEVNDGVGNEEDGEIRFQLKLEQQFEKHDNDHGHPEPRDSLAKVGINANSSNVELKKSVTSAPLKKMKLTPFGLIGEQTRTQSRPRPRSQSGNDHTKEEEREEEDNTQTPSEPTALHSIEATLSQLYEYTHPTIPTQPYTYNRTILPRPSSQSYQPPPTSTSTTGTQTTFPSPPSHPQGVCTPTHLTHQICTHATMLHSSFCVPVGTLCGFHPQKFEVNEGVCPKCIAIPAGELERMIREKVDVAVKRARGRVAFGELGRAEMEVDAAFREVERLRAVWEWVVDRGVGDGMGGGVVKRESGNGDEKGLVGMAERAGGNGGSRDVDVGQKVVDAIESLRDLLGGWVEAGGDEDEVRGRIRDIFGVSG